MTNIPHINVMKKAANSAVRKIMRDFYELELLQNSKKPFDNFISKTIEKIKLNILNEFNSAYPKISIEFDGDLEKSLKLDDKVKFYIIPLDGLNNFKRHIGFFSIIIMRYEQDKFGNFGLTSVLIDSPVMREVFWIEKNKGAWCEKYDSQDAYKLKFSNKIDDKLSAGIDGKINLMCDSLHIAYCAAARFDECIISNNNININEIAKFFASELNGKIIENENSIKIMNN